jgi:hypothetical protein
MEGLLKQTSNTLIQQTPRLLAPNVSETNGPQSDAPTASINSYQWKLRAEQRAGAQDASALIAMRRLGRVDETLQRLCARPSRRSLRSSRGEELGDLSS